MFTPGEKVRITERFHQFEGCIATVIEEQGPDYEGRYPVVVSKPDGSTESFAYDDLEPLRGD